MRSLNSINFTSNNRNRRVDSNTRPEHRLLAANLGCQHAAKPGHFQPDSWLSHEDACLLLRKHAKVAAHTQDYAQAVKLFDRLISYEPSNANHYANRGLMHYSLAQVQKALADYNQALEIDPMLDKVYNNRANLQATQQNWDTAITDYDRAIDLNPLNLRARINQAITFREMGQYEEALACLDIAMFFQADSVVLHATIYAERGRTYHLQGDWNCAIADYKQALVKLQASDLSCQQTELADLVRRHKLTHRVRRWISSLT